MKNTAKEKQTINAPRSFGILGIQYMGFIPIILAIALLFTSISIFIETRRFFMFNDMIILVFLITFLLMIGLSIFYYSQRYIIRIVIDKKANSLRVTRKGTTIKDYNLDMIKHLIFQHFIVLPGSQNCKLICENIDDSSILLIEEDMVFFPNHWAAFSEKISSAIGKPLKKERWIEDFEGRLILTNSQCQSKFFRWMRNRFLFWVPLLISLIGAIAFRLFPNVHNLILFGSATVLVNICMCFIYFLKKSKHDTWQPSNNFTTVAIIIVCTFSLIISFSTIYLVFALPFIDLKTLFNK